MKQVIISVGKAHDSHLAGAILRYTERLNRERPTSWRLVKPSGEDEVTARAVESAAVLKIIDERDFVVLCDERGSEMSSEALAAEYGRWMGLGKRTVFIIGGAYGVDDSLRKRADIVWSLSKLVFPHQLVRLLVVEQLYRANMILKSHPYHHC